MNIRNIHFSISICHRLRSKLALRPAFSCYSQSPSSLSHPVEVQDLVENSPWEWWRPSSGFTLLKIRNVLKLSCHWVVTFLEKTISQFVWMILFHQTCLSRCVMGLFHSFAHTPWSDRKSDRQPNPPPPRKKKNIPTFLPRKKINIKQKLSHELNFKGLYEDLELILIGWRYLWIQLPLKTGLFWKPLFSRPKTNVFAAFWSLQSLSHISDCRGCCCGFPFFLFRNDYGKGLQGRWGGRVILACLTEREGCKSLWCDIMKRMEKTCIHINYSLWCVGFARISFYFSKTLTIVYQTMNEFPLELLPFPAFFPHFQDTLGPAGRLIAVLSSESKLKPETVHHFVMRPGFFPPKKIRRVGAT